MAAIRPTIASLVKQLASSICESSIRKQSDFIERNTCSIVHRIRYQATIWRACSSVVTVCVVNNRQCTRSTPRADRFPGHHRPRARPFPVGRCPRNSLDVQVTGHSASPPWPRAPVVALCRDVDCLTSLFGQRGAVIWQQSARRRVRGCAERRADAIGRPVREQMVDVALAIAHHGDHVSVCETVTGHLATLKPATQFLVVAAVFCGF